jgi:hypothetical protein
MSIYIRKTEDEFEIQQCTPYGWEMVTTETNRRDALDQLHCYRNNDPTGSYRFRKKRVPIEGGVV